MSCQAKTGLFALEPCRAGPSFACGDCGTLFCLRHGVPPLPPEPGRCTACALAAAGRAPSDALVRGGAATGGKEAFLDVDGDETFTEDDLAAMTATRDGDQDDPSRFES